ncbi:MAG: hypothetical protein U7126_30425 [Microcoleus sp.]
MAVDCWLLTVDGLNNTDATGNDMMEKNFPGDWWRYWLLKTEEREFLINLNWSSYRY